ncbi:hypothetical protein [Streptosporangium roseum]|uniref:Core-binding (CB) domain-containing protein n=1 Tax=Streptosporangium roseum (strain ATCC 12428 / DSM 43021 / JCM 3005 / KCTC 9067 / NCIMB 10171 / NRRL 2505 / NI 9100) TaxID=479432 RepID=D2B3K4_STRRD|nr:hypothetical protein [Streptosporangium roseum]ACZ87520.1 hypothetical protein Sros_4666 [Streptosporangium roseum DSM 43021]
MPVVAFPSGASGSAVPSGHPTEVQTVAGAVERFLDSLDAATTRAGYTRTLARLTATVGPHHPVANLDCDHYALVMAAWDSAAAATWNRHLSALISSTTWAQRQDLLATNPARRLLRRKINHRGDRAIPATRLEKSCPRLRPARARGRRHLPATGRGRLSYPRAEYLFKTASAELDPHGDGWTLHQLRHSALPHLAAAGRTAPELQAKSRHQHLASLGRYVRLGEETSARITAEHDPAARRRTRNP